MFQAFSGNLFLADARSIRLNDGFGDFGGDGGEGRLFFKESFPDHSGCVAKSSFRRMGKNVRLNEL